MTATLLVASARRCELLFPGRLQLPGGLAYLDARFLTMIAFLVSVSDFSINFGLDQAVNLRDMW